MATTLRRPFAITGALKQFTQSTSTTASITRSFQTASPFRAARANTKATIFSTSKPTINQLARPQNVFRRGYASYETPNPTASGSLTQRLIYGGALVGGTIIAANLIFNRETREDGGMPPFERSYLNDTFLHTGLGVGIIGVAARALHQSGLSLRIMSANPWLVIIGGVGASFAFMYGCRATAPENYIPKYALWAGFNVTQAVFLAPLMFMQPALLMRAGLYTVAMMGSIAFVGATAKTDKYLYLGGPLLAGVAVVAVSGLAPLVLPATATRTLMVTENLWLWGGLAVFGGFTLYDVQKILHHARLAERGLIKRDAVNESISLELDFLNIFIRMVQILGMQGNRRK